MSRNPKPGEIWTDAATMEIDELDDGVMPILVEIISVEGDLVTYKERYLCEERKIFLRGVRYAEKSSFLSLFDKVDTKKAT